MNPFGQQTVVHTVAKSRSSSERYAAARKRYRSRVIRLSNLRSILFLTAGVFSAGFGLEGFLLPNRFIDGGATGISLLLTDVTNLSLSYLLVLVNIPFILLAYKQVSKMFAVRTIAAIIGLALVVAFVHY